MPLIMTDQQLDALIDRQIEQNESWLIELAVQQEIEEEKIWNEQAIHQQWYIDLLNNTDEMVIEEMVIDELFPYSSEEMRETIMYNKATHD